MLDEGATDANYLRIGRVWEPPRSIRRFLQLPEPHRRAAGTVPTDPVHPSKSLREVTRQARLIDGRISRKPGNS